MKFNTIWFALLVAAALLLTSCKKDDNTVTPPPTTTHASGTYTGMIAGGSESGVLTLNIPTSSALPKTMRDATVITVSGTLNVGGTPITLSGTYDTSNDSLHVSGGGYSFIGTYSNGVLVGSYTGPHGSGGFSTQSSSGTDTVKVYLGSSQSQVSGHSSSTLNIVVKGNKLLGLAVNGSDKTPFAGTISGDAIKLTASFEGLSAVLGGGTFNAGHTSASGTYDTSPWNSSNADHGTWSVQLAH